MNSTKSNTTPGPDSLPVFYKKFWSLVKHQLFLLLDSLDRGVISLQRLNFGVISLIPKVQVLIVSLSLDLLR